MGDRDAGQRRPPPGSRYRHVQAVVESGLTVQVARYMREREIKTRRQPGELFTRLRSDVVAASLAASSGPAALHEDGGYARPMDEYDGGKSGLRRVSTEGGGGEAEMEYLLLDCRSAEDYARCHIIGALHYPKAKLNHAMHPFLPEMFTFKNKPNKTIVLYDLEEEVVGEFGNVLCQKGVDNVAIIAGGLAEFVQDYAPYITGESPVPIVPRDKRLQRRADEVTVARSEATSVVHKPVSLSSSLARPKVRTFISSKNVSTSTRPSPASN